MVKGDIFRTKFNDVVMVVLSQEPIQAKLKSTLLYKPLTNFVTFGLYNLIAGSSEESHNLSNASSDL